MGRIILKWIIKKYDGRATNKGEWLAVKPVMELHVPVMELEAPLQVAGIRMTGEGSVGNYKEKIADSAGCYAGFFFPVRLSKSSGLPMSRSRYELVFCPIIFFGCTAASASSSNACWNTLGTQIIHICELTFLP